VEFGPLLGFVFGFEEMADGAEAAGEALAAFGRVIRQIIQFGQQDVGGTDVLFDALDATRPRWCVAAGWDNQRRAVLAAFFSFSGSMFGTWCVLSHGASTKVRSKRYQAPK